jgi:hypothetical protein
MNGPRPDQRTHQEETSMAHEADDAAPQPQAVHASAVTQAGFTMIPNAVMLRGDLTAAAKLAYGYLKHLAWRGDTDEAAPARDELGRVLGLADKAVTTAVQSLARAPVVEGDDDADARRLVVVVRRGLGMPNLYVVNDPADRQNDESGRVNMTRQEGSNSPDLARARPNRTSKTLRARRGDPPAPLQ